MSNKSERVRTATVFESRADFPPASDFGVGPIVTRMGDHYWCDGLSYLNLKSSRNVIEAIGSSNIYRPANKAVALTSGLWVADLANVINPHLNLDKINIEGGAYIVDGTNLALKSATVGFSNIGVTEAYSTLNALEFYTNAVQLMFRFFSPQNNAVKIYIDGHPVVKALKRVVDYSGQAIGATSFIQLDWTSFGGSENRLIRIEYDATSVIRLSTDAGKTIWAPYDSRPKFCFFGDSFFALGAGQLHSTPTFFVDNIAARVAKNLGAKCTASAVGGTGFGNNGGTNFNYAHPKRLADLSLQAFDAIIISGGTNDSSAENFSNVRLNCRALLTEARSAMPSSPIVLCGVINGEVSGTNSMSAIENKIKQAFDDFDDGNALFVAMTNDPDGAWINSANKSKYIAADNTHCLPNIGEEYISSRLTEKIYSFLR